MPRLHVVKLREAAASRGDTSDYKIVQRTGISRAAISRLVNQKVEPTVSTLLRLKCHYGLGVEDMIQMIELPEAS